MISARRLMALTAGAATIAGAGAATATAAPMAGSDADRATKPAVREVPADEQRSAERLDIEHITRVATPLPMPKGGTSGSGADEARGTPSSVPPAGGKGGSAARADAARASAEGLVWPGANTANPNRQIGKLYFDTDPGPATRWSWCSASAVNSTNKSVVITAGHCVYDRSSQRWYTRHIFYPGYEYGASPDGVWTARTLVTTGSYYSSGNYADDMAAVVVNTRSGVRLVNRVGGHGIMFNAAARQSRWSFGYPATDWRWPGYVANGQDMRYCQGTNAGPYSGQLYLRCRMTGGSSGGPWLTRVQRNWLGYVNSVNSNKGGIGSAYAYRMYGPYFGNAERAVYNYARNR